MSDEKSTNAVHEMLETIAKSVYRDNVADNDYIGRFKFMYGSFIVPHVMREGNVEWLKCLCSIGLSPTLETSDTSVELAARHGRLEMVKHLVSIGEAATHNDNEDVFALQYAAEAGHLDVVKHLVSIGATMNCTKIIDGAIHAAAKNNHTDVVMYLASVYETIIGKAA
jgi:ankyrin repeat protein